MLSWAIWKRTKLIDSMSTSMSVSDQDLIVSSFTAIATRACYNLCYGKFAQKIIIFFDDFFKLDFTLDRDHKGASEDDDDEAPRISLQEMLEDLHLEEPSSGTETAAMITE